MTAPAATSDAVRTSELRRFGGGCVGFSAAARQARLVAAMAQTMPCCGRRMVVVVRYCRHCAATLILIDVRARAHKTSESLCWRGCCCCRSCVVVVTGVKFCKRTTPETYSKHS